MEIAGAVALVLFLAFVTLAVVAAVRTVRAVRHGVERGTAQARRMVEDNRLRARRYTLPGAAGELARLRLSLRQSIDATYSALEERRAQDASLTEAATLLARLDDHARTLDAELRLLEREPDKARIADRLPALTERTQRITHSADALRFAAQDRARHLAEDDLTALGRDIELEVGALRHWAPVDGGAPDSAPPPSRPGLEGEDTRASTAFGGGTAQARAGLEGGTAQARPGFEGETTRARAGFEGSEAPWGTRLGARRAAKPGPSGG